MTETEHLLEAVGVSGAEPGHGWAYHGGNYIVLRLLVEEATGSSLRDALRERIFEPLGLERTDLVEGPLRGDCAHGYLPRPDHSADGKEAIRVRCRLGPPRLLARLRRDRAVERERRARQVVICASGQPASEAAEGAFFDAAGEFAWHLFCA